MGKMGKMGTHEGEGLQGCGVLARLQSASVCGTAACLRGDGAPTELGHVCRAAGLRRACRAQASAGQSGANAMRARARIGKMGRDDGRQEHGGGKYSKADARRADAGGGSDRETPAS